MKIYIAGKITGDENYREKFAAAEKALRDKGHIPLNPATQPEGLRKEDYMRVCFAMLETADLVLFLEDYKESKGAMLEKAWCEYMGKMTVTAERAEQG